MAKVVYEEKEIELSREYPFGKKVKVKELNGHDDITIEEQQNAGKNGGYVQISISTGLTYDEALTLARKDAQKITKELEGF